MDGSDHVVVKHVAIARDLGPVVELAAGLNPDDRVIANPPDGIITGDAVRIAGSAGKVTAKAN